MYSRHVIKMFCEVFMRIGTQPIFYIFSIPFSLSVKSSMLRQIYEIFTQKNNILLSSAQMKMLNERKYTIEKYKKIADEYLRHFHNGVATNENLNFVIERIEKSLTCDIFRLKGFEKEFSNDLERYYFLQSMTKGDDMIIFGMYYRNKFDENVVEDDESVVKVRFNIDEDLFIFDGMFFGAAGSNENGEFEIKRIYLPEITVGSIERWDLMQKNVTIAFFSNMKLENETLDRIKAVECDILVLTGKFNVKNISSAVTRFANTCKNDIIVMLDRHEPVKTILPVNFDIKDKPSNLHPTTNPSRIQLHNMDIMVVKDEICAKKVQGTFFKENYYESFTRTFLSQYTYNFDIGFKEMPRLIFVGQNTRAFVVECDGVILASCGGDDNAYIEYCTASGTAAIKYLVD
ncbi:DNA-directed DNA polymerase [Trachipleistophora hominis]|uniref:DNA-directed DNA polymerase n=1 Tax=Trachipleistophora hominis TaxID=72359 RepID=L7JV59_TRAHO|nr:DNA-directed DNA polymerase [Trachipleistophora hominis]